MTNPVRRATIVVLAMLLSGCGVGYKDLPLPGSKVRGEVYQVSATFDQALNLAQGAQVKVNGVSVGRVASVAARNYRAYVTMDIRSETAIPSDSSARLRYDTPLGELIIQVAPGTSPTNLADGGHFAKDKATTAPSVEDALQSASTLINGGNLGELEVLATELNAAFHGREREIRDSTAHLAEFLAEANASSDDIDDTLRALSRVSVTLNEHRATIRKALDDIGPAVDTLSEDTDEFIDVLGDADHLARRTRLIALKVKDPLLEILTQLGPIADEILSTRGVFRPSLDALIAVAAQLDKTVPSETLPLLALIHLDQTQLAAASADSQQSQAGPSGSGPSGSPQSRSPQLPIPNLIPQPPTDVVNGVTGSLLKSPSLLPDLNRLLGEKR
jgi:phospholipid/cholesterol/gamma-HCH transport system substrate-binding protein